MEFKIMLTLHQTGGRMNEQEGLFNTSFALPEQDNPVNTFYGELISTRAREQRIPSYSEIKEQLEVDCYKGFFFEAYARF